MSEEIQDKDDYIDSDGSIWAEDSITKYKETMALYDVIQNSLWKLYLQSLKTDMLYINDIKKELSFRCNTNRPSEATNQAVDLGISHFTITSTPEYRISILED